MSTSDRNSSKEDRVDVQEASPDNASGGVDTAWKYLDTHRDADVSEQIDLTALRRKIDWHIVPLMFLCYTLQFLDKVILNVRGAPLPPHTHPTDRRLICATNDTVRKCDGHLERPEPVGQ
jgi:hypothetical protein